MKGKRFTEGQIITDLKEHEAGMKTGDLVRKRGISEATIYNWKARFGGVDVTVMWSGWHDTTALFEAQDDERVKYAFAVFKCSIFFYFAALISAFLSPLAGHLIG